MVHSSEHIENRSHRAVEAQGRFARRHGEVIELPNADADGFDRWNVAGVVSHDDHAPVILRAHDGKRTVTIPALHLDRYESAARGHRASVGAAEVLSVESIEGEPDRSEIIEAILQRLGRRERYASAGVMASAFPEEIAAAARAALG